MSIIKFNIGLQKNDGSGELDAGFALKTLPPYIGAYPENIDSLKIEKSDTERTLVVALFTPFTNDIIEPVVHDLCAVLQQDCIAYKLNCKGYLVGPRADKWGAFNEDFFIN